MRFPITQLVILLGAGLVPAVAQVAVRDAEGQAHLAFPAPDFLPDRPYAVLRMASPQRLLKRSLPLLARVGRPSDLSRAMRMAGRIAGGHVPPAGVSWSLPSWVVVDEPDRFTPELMLAQRGVAALLEARLGTGFMALPIRNRRKFLEAMKATHGEPKVIDTETFSWIPEAPPIDYSALAKQLIEGRDEPLDVPNDSGLHLRLTDDFGLLARQPDSLARAQVGPQTGRWIGLSEALDDPTDPEELSVVTLTADRRAPFPDADLVLTLDMVRLRDFRHAEVRSEIESLRPRSAPWVLPFLDDFESISRVIYALTFEANGLRLDIVIEATPDSPGLTSILQHDPARSTGMLERLGATSELRSTTERWELKTHLPVESLARLAEWFQTAPAVPSIQTRLRLADLAQRYRRQGKAAFVEPTLDGWGRRLQHEDHARGLRLFSLGADGQPGGAGDDADTELVIKR